MKNYLLTVLEQCTDKQFGQDAIEWAIVSGHVKLTYDLDADVRAIMGSVPDGQNGRDAVTNYDRLIEAYRRTIEEHGAALLDIYHASGLMDEILRSVPLLPPEGRVPRVPNRELVQA